MVNDTPKPLEIWKHVDSGELYIVILVTNQTANRDGWVPTVSYVNAETKQGYSRDLETFKSRFSLFGEVMMKKSLEEFLKEVK